MSKHRRARIKLVHQLLDEFHAEGCVICGERERCCLTAHHVEPATKRFNVSQSVVRTNISIQAIRTELRKCASVCLNDHARIHRGLIQWPPKE